MKELSANARKTKRHKNLLLLQCALLDMMQIEFQIHPEEKPGSCIHKRLTDPVLLSRTRCVVSNFKRQYLEEFLLSHGMVMLNFLPGCLGNGSFYYFFGRSTQTSLISWSCAISFLLFRLKTTCYSPFFSHSLRWLDWRVGGNSENAMSKAAGVQVVMRSSV